MARIVAPVPFTGTGVGGTEFVDGVAVTDNGAVIAYCRDLGYEVMVEKLERTEPKRRTAARGKH